MYVGAILLFASIYGLILRCNVKIEMNTHISIPPSIIIVGMVIYLIPFQLKLVLLYSLFKKKESCN